jgi:hypothetical protein
LYQEQKDKEDKDLGFEKVELRELQKENKLNIIKSKQKLSIQKLPIPK